MNKFFFLFNSFYNSSIGNINECIEELGSIKFFFKSRPILLVECLFNNNNTLTLSFFIWIILLLFIIIENFYISNRIIRDDNQAFSKLIQRNNFSFPFISDCSFNSLNTKNLFPSYSFFLVFFQHLDNEVQ